MSDTVPAPETLEPGSFHAPHICMICEGLVIPQPGRKEPACEHHAEPDPDSPVVHDAILNSRIMSLRDAAGDMRRILRGLDRTETKCPSCTGRRFANYTEYKHAIVLESFAERLEGMAGSYATKLHRERGWKNPKKGKKTTKKEKR